MSDEWADEWLEWPGMNTSLPDLGFFYNGAESFRALRVLRPQWEPDLGRHPFGMLLEDLFDPGKEP